MYNTRVLIIALLLLAVAAIVALWREQRRAAELGPGRGLAAGRVERCLVCHHRPHEDPGGVHSAAALGCSSCHLGDPLALDKRRAHAGMEPEPGALSTVDRTCGRAGCHQREAARVRGSLMATVRGLIAVDRWVFGELPTPDGTQQMTALLALKNPSPAQQHLRKLCAGCHLHSRKQNRDDAVRGIGSGCSACHYSTRRAGASPTQQHGPVDARVPDERCLGCHSRSGRIALSYQGLAEVEEKQRRDCARPRRLHDGRPACGVPADVHHRQGLACVDCHLHTGLMGTGKAHAHKEQQVEITCEACHQRRGSSPGVAWARLDDPISETLLRLRGKRPSPLQLMRQGRLGTPLWNLTRQATAGAFWTLQSKVTGRLHPVRPTPEDADHRLAGHRRLSCQACHSTWAPNCTTCHVRFDAAGKQWDFGRAAVTRGAWKETSEAMSWGPPALAVNAAGRIAPAVPGMILTIQGTGQGPIRRRLFAPTDPHTTSKKSRNCAGCHRSPEALGLGTGQLDLRGPRARFTPRLAGAPGAPARDGWTTLDAARPAAGTRTGLRSFNARELRKVLAVGRCVPCHKKAADPIYQLFARSMETFGKKGSSCELGNGRQGKEKTENAER